jgi:hypothetical protein
MGNDNDAHEVSSRFSVLSDARTKPRLKPAVGRMVVADQSELTLHLARPRRIAPHAVFPTATPRLTAVRQRATDLRRTSAHAYSQLWAVGAASGWRRNVSGFVSWWRGTPSGTVKFMSYIMVDVESDGPIPGDFSMVCFGAVVVEPGLNRTFYGRVKPISEQWIPDALKVSGFTREQALGFDEPTIVMAEFAAWLSGLQAKRLIFVSDNNGYDWQFINWYFHHFLKRNPFGFSSQNLGSLYKGLVKDTFATFKHLRRTAHTHHPVDDARGNAEALLHMKAQMALKIALD